MSSSPVLWDVDTQVDFVARDGRLSVPGAEATRPAMALLVAAARAAGLVHVASADDHEPGDPELSDTPDYRTTYPPHCLRGTDGAAKIPETRQTDPLVLPHEPLGEDELARALDGRREVLIPKKRFDVFTNPNTDALVRALAPPEALVFGVATDVCVHAAVEGLRARGVPVAVIADACRGLDPGRVERCQAAWREAGVRLTTTDEVVVALR